jgi:mono/diheme cytochrome c family protein
MDRGAFLKSLAGADALSTTSSRLMASSALLVAAFTACGAPAAAETLLERGSYLVNAVMACDSCHTPRRPDGAYVMEKRFSGGSQTWDEPAFVVKGANITPDPDTGIGGWSEDDLKDALSEGVRPPHARLGGVHLVPQMPFNFYRILLPRDLEAVVAYVRTVAPVRNEVPSPVYKAPTQATNVPGAERPIQESELRDPVRRGFYLTTIAHCMECHARRPDGVYDFTNWLGRGRPRNDRSFRGRDRSQYHFAPDSRHRRMDRRRNQACAHAGCVA